MKVDVFHDAQLIDLEGSVVPAVRDLFGNCGLVAYEIVRRIESDDGGLDGDGLAIFEDCLGEADRDAGPAGGVGVVVDDLAEQNVTVTKFGSSAEVNVAGECGTELIAVVDAIGIQRAGE